MINISEKTHIAGLEKGGISRSHLHQCLHDKNMHDVPYFYLYCGIRVVKGYLVIHSCKGDFDIEFDTKDGWARFIKIYTY